MHCGHGLKSANMQAELVRRRTMLCLSGGGEPQLCGLQGRSGSVNQCPAEVERTQTIKEGVDVCDVLYLPKVHLRCLIDSYLTLFPLHF